MPEEKKTLSFPLPDGGTVNAYVVRLDNGKTVVRSEEELLDATPKGV